MLSYVRAQPKSWTPLSDATPIAITYMQFSLKRAITIHQVMDRRARAHLLCNVRTWALLRKRSCRQVQRAQLLLHGICVYVYIHILTRVKEIRWKRQLSGATVAVISQPFPAVRPHARGACSQWHPCVAPRLIFRQGEGELFQSRAVTGMTKH